MTWLIQRLHECPRLWSALRDVMMPHVDPDRERPLERMPVSASLSGSGASQRLRLVPLLSALEMSRIWWMFADVINGD